jgi:hypothetical protein
VGQVLLHGVDRDDEPVGDLPVCQAPGEQQQHLGLALGQRLDQHRRA